MMQRLTVWCVPLLAACVMGCGQQTTYQPRAAGTLALTQDDSTLYAVDSDNGIVVLVDTRTEQPIQEIAVGRLPEQILIGPDDTAFVANRGDRTVSVIRRDALDAVETVFVGVEPVGLALSRDAKLLYVVNAVSSTDVEHGSLMAVDTGRLTVEWELALPPEPRAIALLSDERAVISLFKAGDVVEVDLAARAIVRDGTGLEERANQVDLATAPRELSTVSPRAMNQLVVSPDGERVYATVTWASNAVLSGAPAPGAIDSQPVSTYGSSPSSPDPSQGCAIRAVTTPGIVTFEAGTLRPLVEALQSCGADELDLPSARLTPAPGAIEPLQGPSAMVLDHGGEWLFVAMRESNNVAIVPASIGGEGARQQEVSLEDGAGPSGLALTSDGKTLYVYNSFAHEIRKLESSGSTARVIAREKRIRIAEDPEWLRGDAAIGRKLFFSATNPAMNDPHQVGIACSSCHLDGRDDGHVWNFTEGPRQTPSLAGRSLGLTAPFHWGGEHADFPAFLKHTVEARMGGHVGDAQPAQLQAFFRAMPTPDNPNQLASPTAAQLRGAMVFQKAECSTCHQGASLTDEKFHDVGTLVGNEKLFLEKLNGFGGLNTPSLLGIGRTAPYLHDGSAATLRDRLAAAATDQHGKTSGLTEAEVSDLVEYLKAL